MALRQINQKLPRIFRFITERVIIPHLAAAKIILLCLFSLFLLGAIVNQSLILKNNLKDLKKITQERQNIQKEVSYWKQVSEGHRAYADIYLKIASLEYRLGNTKNSESFMEKALSLDPDTKQGRVLGEYVRR